MMAYQHYEVYLLASMAWESVPFSKLFRRVQPNVAARRSVVRNINDGWLKSFAHDVKEHLINMGEYIGNKWEQIALKYNLNIKITDFKPLITFKFQYGELNSALYTLFIQEMLKRKYIVSNSIYLSYAHEDVDIQNYLTTVDEVFKYIKECIDNDTVLDVLKTKIKSEGFKRLN